MSINSSENPAVFFPPADPFSEVEELVWAQGEFTDQDQFVLTDNTLGDTTHSETVSLDMTRATALSQWFLDVSRQVTRLAVTRGRKNHLVLRGETLCQYDVAVSGSSKPFGVISPSSADDSPHNWYVPLDHMGELSHPEPMCTGCRSKGKRMGIIDPPGRFGGAAPPECPECGEQAHVFSPDCYGCAAKITHGIAEDRTTCKLTRDQTKTHYRNVLAVSPDNLPLVDSGPDEYIQDFPDIVSNTTGLVCGYCQPRVKGGDRRGLSRNRLAAFFCYHPDWSVTFALGYKHWGPLYEKATSTGE